MAVELLPDELWSGVQPLLPPPPPPSRKGGRPRVDNRTGLHGILFVNKTGMPWQMLPAEVFGVSGSSGDGYWGDRTARGIRRCDFFGSSGAEIGRGRSAKRRRNCVMEFERGGKREHGGHEGEEISGCC
jgi:Putative transposase of IS4/5 family (DUF4096)